MVNDWGKETLMIPIEQTANRLVALKKLSPVVRSEVEMRALDTA